ncbi:MAG: hypothetical protein U5L72_13510 [Bacteroidales bacterium]|nr:hypothetical protein [Bacteroidales bacterium]
MKHKQPVIFNEVRVEVPGSGTGFDSLLIFLLEVIDPGTQVMNHPEIWFQLHRPVDMQACLLYRWVLLTQQLSIPLMCR